MWCPLPQVVTSPSPTGHLPRLLASLGMTPLGAPLPLSSHQTIWVLLDGKVLGEVAAKEASQLALKLRTLKALGKEKVEYMHMYMCMCVRACMHACRCAHVYVCLCVNLKLAIAATTLWLGKCTFGNFFGTI